MKTTLRHVLAGAALTGSLAASLVSPATAAPATAPAPEVTIAVGRLDRGADVGLPYVEGRRIVDGRRSVVVRGRALSLLGTHGDEYVASVLRQGTYRVVAVRLDGIERELADGTDPGTVALSADGSRLATWRPTRRETRMLVVDTGDASILAADSVPGYADVLDVDDTQLLLSQLGGRRSGTTRWVYPEDRLERVMRASAYLASITDDRVATFDRDPYDGGCSAVRTLSEVRTVLSRSCRERVLAFAPGGRRIATVGILSDGPGPNQVTVGRANGRTEARYEVARGFFGFQSTAEVWEDSSTLLVKAVARRFQADIRCAGGACERTGDLERSQGA